MSRLGRLLRGSRPRFWLYLAGPVLVGLAYGASSVGELLSPVAVALFAYFLVPANSYLYGINDIFDARIDRENPKKEDREIRYRGGSATPVVVVVSGALGIAFLPILPAASWPYLLGFLLLGAAYSAPPLRFKTVPPLDSLSNGLYILPGAAAYAAVTGTHPPALALLGGWVWAMAMHTFSAIPDIEPDRRGGIRTLATVLGRRGALVYCACCWLLAAGIFALLDPRAGVLLVAYPVLVAGIVATDSNLDRAYWWYPAINTAVGMVFTLGGLWSVFYG